jgi:hypothetical protein
LGKRNVSLVRADDLAISSDLRAELEAFFTPDLALLARIPEINEAGLARLAMRAAGSRAT